MTAKELRSWAVLAVILATFTVVYNIGEGVIAIYYGMEEESISLLGFGCDSFVEVFSAIICLIQLFTKDDIFKTQKEEKIEDPEKAKAAAEAKAAKRVADLKCERTSTRIIGVMLFLLALSAMASSVYRLAKHEKPETAVPGMVVSVLSLSFMYFLWFYKLKAAKILDSKTLESDAQCSKGCIQLSCTLFIGSLLQILGEKVFHTEGLWWVDAVAGFIIAIFILHDGYSCIKNASSKDFDGNCGCCQIVSKEGEIEEKPEEVPAENRV